MVEILDIFENTLAPYLEMGPVTSFIVFNLLMIIGLFIIYKITTHFIKRIFEKVAKTRKEKSDTTLFIRLWKYIYIIAAVLAILFSNTGSLAWMGVSAALITAALGWALQRPITGIAGWVMVIFSKPFRIGDRISIGAVRGDVMNITLTHVYIGEIGGTTGSDDRSGRIVMVPNSKLFEVDIINYTLMDEFVTDEVSTRVTFDSNLEKAKEFWYQATMDIIKKYDVDEKPNIYTYFSEHGIQLTVRYRIPAEHRERVKSDITNIVYDNVSKENDVRFAFPHTEVILNKSDAKPKRKSQGKRKRKKA